MQAHLLLWTKCIPVSVLLLFRPYLCIWLVFCSHAVRQCARLMSLPVFCIISNLDPEGKPISGAPVRAAACSWTLLGALRTARSAWRRSWRC